MSSGPRRKNLAAFWLHAGFAGANRQPGFPPARWAENMEYRLLRVGGNGIRCNCRLHSLSAGRKKGHRQPGQYNLCPPCSDLSTLASRPRKQTGRKTPLWTEFSRRQGYGLSPAACELSAKRGFLRQCDLYQLTQPLVFSNLSLSPIISWVFSRWLDDYYFLSFPIKRQMREQAGNRKR